MSLGAPAPIDRALLPADIRSAPPARQQAYAAALGFERLLVQQLTSSLAASTQDAMGGKDSPYASLLPDALAQGVMDGGGLGLAAQLTDAIEPAAGGGAA
jgi:Rod binding domain-containing protein